MKPILTALLLILSIAASAARPVDRNYSLVLAATYPFLPTQHQLDSARIVGDNAVVIFYDTDGAFLVGTSWNFTGAPLTLPASTKVNNPGAHDTLLRFGREFFASFNVVVTDDSTLWHMGALGRRIWVIFTPYFSWYGPPTGGTSIINAMNFPIEVPGQPDLPSFAFDTAGSTKTLAIIGAHEAGHQMGLQHKGTVSNEYDGGYGTAGTQTSFAPIMGGGASYLKNSLIWWDGLVRSWDANQDDVEVIGGSVMDRAPIGFVGNDIGKHWYNARILVQDKPMYQLLAVRDSDYYKIDLSEPHTISLTVVPESFNPSGNVWATGDLAIDLLKEDLTPVSSSANTTVLNASLSIYLRSGVYYIKVRPDRSNPDNPTGYGFSCHYTITLGIS